MATFDSIQRNLVDKVNNLYGELASWTPSIGGSALTGSILFKDGSQALELSDVQYDPRHVIAEYFDNDFPGLLDAANSNQNEVITIKSVDYYVRIVRNKYDGKTNVAVLEIKP